MMGNMGKGSLYNMRTMQVQISLRNCFPLSESVDTVVYDYKQKIPRLDCTDVHADLDLRCPQNA